MIRTYRQFINWHYVPEPGKKPKKVPFDAVTGFPIDHLKPENWKTHDQATATGHPVGFVFTDADPFFFLDLDDCRSGNGWNDEATAIFQQFAGAAAEISISGTGLHIVGTCDKSRLMDRKHRFGTVNRPSNWLEFYTAGRFMALGHGFTGDFGKDCTATLLQMVPAKTPAELVTTAFEDKAVAEWTGTNDDDELLRLAMRSKSVGGAFGTKATFAELWSGDAAALVQAFPSVGGDVFDRSRADAALMSHLAFWTGKNPVRMDRLYRRSMLMRPKYESRPEYAADTIRNAISGQTGVYNVPREEQATRNPAEFLTINEMVEWFAGCVYIRAVHKIMVPGGDLLKPEQFRVQYGGKEFQMQGDNGRPSRDAFEAFTQNRAWNFPKVFDMCFRPLEAPGVIINGLINVYQPQPVVRRPGDISPFVEFLKKLLPDQRDRDILLAYMAALIRNPGVKFQWAVVLQGVEGNGKSFITRYLSSAVGARYSHSPAAEDLSNKFNAFLENKLFIGVEEIHMRERREVLDSLKPWITNERIEVQNKGGEKRMIDNVANWVFCTNHRDAIMKTRNDRRYAVLFTAQQVFDDLSFYGMTGDYFPNLYRWARSGGYEMITDYLMDYAIPADLNPAGDCHRAPETSTTDEAIEASLGRIEQEILHMIKMEEPGFRNGWISSYPLDVMLKEKGLRIARNKVAPMLESLGYREVGRVSRVIGEEDGKRPVLFVHRTLYNRSIGIEEYALAQGYRSLTPPSLVNLPRGARLA